MAGRRDERNRPAKGNIELFSLFPALGIGPLPAFKTVAALFRRCGNMFCG